MNRIALLWISLLVSVPALAQDPHQMFEEANLLYQQGKPAEAVAVYDSLLAEGYTSGELFYNLGNAHYKSGNVARAILNYERAVRLIPGDEDLRHNLMLANMMITDKLDPAPRLFVWDYWDGIKAAFSPDLTSWLLFMFVLITACGVASFLLARTYALRKGSLVGIAASGLCVIFLLIIFIGKVGDINRKDAAIVTIPITTVKNSPDNASSDAFVLHGGVKVTIIDQVNTWLKIRLPDGKVGWMDKGAVEVI